MLNLFLEPAARRKFVVIAAICIFGQTLVPEAIADQTQIDFRNIEVLATIRNGELRLTVRNHSSNDYLILDEFCFDAHLHSRILIAPSLKPWAGGFFSNGLARKQGRMMRLKANGERSCEIGYFESPTRNSIGHGRGFVVWNTNLFVGDFYDHFDSKEFSGVIPISFPTIVSGPENSPPADTAILERYRNRKTLGVIE